MMTDKRFTMETERINDTYCCRILENDKVLFEVSNWSALSQSNNKEVEELVDCLNVLYEENQDLATKKEDAEYELLHLKEKYEELLEENEQLKQELYDCKKDEKQLSISFMEFKMQLVEVLQQNYNYAYNQRQRNLDNSIVARTYEVLYQTIDIIAENMNVDIERFPKGDFE